VKKLFIHVGPHKTGTTYIQEILESNSKRLQKHGYTYPKIFYMAKGQHHIVTHLLQNNNQEDFLQECQEINESENDIILSSENFIYLNRKQLERLRDLFEKRDIILIFYFRNPLQRFFSYWQEMIKHGETISYFNFFTRNSMFPFATKQLNTLVFLKKLIAVFGKESVRIIDYDHASSEKKVFELFEKVLGTALHLESNKVVNQSMDIGEVEIIRYLNIQGKERGILQGSNIRESYRKAVLKNKITDKIELVKSIQEQYKFSLNYGETYIDREIYNIYRKQYSTLVVNDIAQAKSKKQILISEEWMMHREIKPIIKSIEKDIFKELK